MNSQEKECSEDTRIFVTFKAPTNEQIVRSDGSFMDHKAFQLLRDTGEIREIQKPSLLQKGLYEETEASDDELKDWLDIRKQEVERARENVIRHYRRCRERGIDPATVNIPELDDLAYEVSRANNTVSTLLERLKTKRNAIPPKLKRTPDQQFTFLHLTAEICRLKADRDFINAKPRLSYITMDLPASAPKKRKSGRDRTINRQFRLQEVTA